MVVCVLRLQCWENQFGSEMYKLVMLDFMASILNTLLVDLPTRSAFL